MKDFINFKNIDPTQTSSLRKNFSSQMIARYRYIISLISKSIDKNDCFSLKQKRVELFKRIPSDSSWKNTIDPLTKYDLAGKTREEKISTFIKWLDDAENKSLLQSELRTTQFISPPFIGLWTDKFIEAAYKHGIIWARQRLKENKGVLDLLKPDTLYTDGRDLVGTFFKTENQAIVAALYENVKLEIEDIISSVNSQVSRVLTYGILTGIKANKLAKQINERVAKVGIHRAVLIARTEIIRAHHLSTLEEYKAAGIDKVTVKAEWITAGDSRVCQRCKDMEGRIFTIEEVTPLIPLHPQCRCATLPYIE